MYKELNKELNKASNTLIVIAALVLATIVIVNIHRCSTPAYAAVNSTNLK
jgi:hypothetical protein